MRGGRWSVDGPLAVLDAAVRDGVIRTAAYPDALARVWSALICETSGDVLLSAAPGWEFADWGGVDHVGGGSHGSLHRSDSLGALAFCGVGLPDRRRRGASRHRRLVRALRAALAPVSTDDSRMPLAARVGTGCAARELAAARALRLVGGSGYVVNLAFHAARARRRHRPPLAAWRVPRRGRQQLRVEPALDVPRHARARGRQAVRFLRRRVGRSSSTSSCSSCSSRRRLAEVPSQAIAIAAATPLNFLGNKLWTFGR